MSHDHHSPTPTGASSLHGTGLVAGLQPAFQHTLTGESHLSQTSAGFPAAVYGFDGLPDDWIAERDPDGKAIALHPDIVAGYWLNARFVALSQLICMPHNA